MTWIKDFVEKIGGGEAWKLYENSPEKKPDDFDIDAAAKDYLDTRLSIYKSSDDYKRAIKEASIVGIKQYKKKINDELGLGLSGEEAGTLDPDEFLSKAKEKITTDIENSKSSKTAEWQDKYKSIETEFNGFKKKFEETETEWKNKYTELETRAEREAAQIKRNQLFSELFNKIDFGQDPAHRENAKIVVQTVMKERGWNFKDDGGLYKGENDVVLNSDGHTVLKSLEEGIKSIATERKLFPQSNSGGGPSGARGNDFKGTGDAETDKLIQQQLAAIDRLDKM